MSTAEVMGLAGRESTPRAARKCSKDEGVQFLEVGQRKASQLGGRLEEARRELAEDVFSVRRQGDGLHSPIFGSRGARDEPAALEPIDDTGDVRRIARQRLGNAAHVPRWARRSIYHRDPPLTTKHLELRMLANLNYLGREAMAQPGHCQATE